MRICLISNGKSEHIHRLSNYLVSLNHEVHLISGRTKEAWSAKVILHPLGANPILWPLQAKQFVDSIKPDIVDGHFISIYGFIAACTGFHPLVVTGWGSDVLINPWKNLLWRLTAQYAVQKSDRVIILFSRDTAKTQLEKLGVKAEKLREALLGVDTGMFHYTGKLKESAEFVGINPACPIAISTRGFASIYGTDTLLKAIPLVLEKIPEAQFIILQKPGERITGEALVKKAGIHNNVFLVDRIPHSDMPTMLSLADVYISASLSDGASNSLFEAMACERAPVVTDIPANRPWVADGENGFLFQTGDYNALAEKITFLLNDERKRSSFGKKCREIVCEKAEQKIQMAKIESIYQETIKEYSN